jgi:hypothetical protein
MKLFKNYKFKCSELGDVMAGSIKSQLTEKQEETLKELQSKPNLTEKQQELLNTLLEKKNLNPTISKATLTFLKKLAIKIETGREEILDLDALHRGARYENEAIEVVSKVYNTTYTKNEQKYENDYIVGIPDIIYKTEKEFYIREIKNSQDIFSHPYYDSELPNPNYYWQVQGYMMLTDAPVAYIDYVLLDAPEWWINKKLKSKHYDLTDKELDDEQYNQEMEEYELKLRFNNTYQDLDIKRRVKTFIVERDEVAIQKIKEQIELVKEYEFSC